VTSEGGLTLPGEYFGPEKEIVVRRALECEPKELRGTLCVTNVSPSPGTMQERLRHFAPTLGHNGFPVPLGGHWPLHSFDESGL
jgi:hypothetical protein